MPRLSVIVVNYNSGARLARCLKHLSRQTFKDFETLVVDNGSADDSIEQAKKIGVAVDYDLAGANLGFAAANNRAVKGAHGEWVVFLNPDAYAEPDWLHELVAATERHPSADAFGSTQINAYDPSKIDGAGDVFHILGIAYRGHFGWPVEKLPPEGDCFSACAAAAMYRKAIFEKLGGFDERFFCYGEDVDLGFRLRLAGGRAVQVRNARVLHEGSGVTGRHSDFTVYHGHRNRIWTVSKNMPEPLRTGFAPLRAMVDFYLFFRLLSIGKGRSYLKAIRDGYGGAGQFRNDRQSLRSSQIAPLLKAMTWSLLKVTRREADIRSAGNGAKLK